MKSLLSQRGVNKRIKWDFDQTFIDQIANKGNPFHYFYQQTHGSIQLLFHITYGRTQEAFGSINHSKKSFTENCIQQFQGLFVLINE